MADEDKRAVLQLLNDVRPPYGYYHLDLEFLDGTVWSIAHVWRGYQDILGLACSMAEKMGVIVVDTRRSIDGKTIKRKPLNEG